MYIPKQILIEIVNQNNENLDLEILFGLKIFINNESCHNYSMIKTLSNGKKFISQEDIINNTELKHLESISNFESEKIEFYIWSCEARNSLINCLKATENTLNQENPKEVIENELINRGSTAEDAEKYSIEMVEKLRGDLKMLTDLYDCKNCETLFKIESIIDIWKDNSSKTYKFVVI